MLEVVITKDGELIKRVTVCQNNNAVTTSVLSSNRHNGNFFLENRVISEPGQNLTEEAVLKHLITIEGICNAR